MHRQIYTSLTILILWVFAIKAFAQINVEATIDMGRQNLYYDDYVTAISRFNEVLLVRPKKAEVYYYRGYAKFSLEDYSGGEEDCTEAIALNPFRMEFYQLRGLCRINRENYQGAVDDYCIVLRDNPDEQNARYNRAICFLQLKNYLEADQDLDFMIRRWPQLQKTYLVKAQSLLEQGDTTACVFWVDSLLHRAPYNRDALTFKGRYYLWKEDYQQADSFLTMAIKFGANNIENYISRAQARHGMNHYNEALSDYDYAIERIPEHFVAHYNRGLLRALIGADNLALEDFDFILSIEPDNTLARYNRAQLREGTGDYRGAEEDFTLLIQSYPTFYYAYAARARCRHKLGKKALAIQDETIVTQANLNLVFGKQGRKNVRKVRSRSDHELDHYQDLVKEDDDKPIYQISDVAGKVQNRDINHVSLPPFPIEEIQRVLTESPDNTGANARLHYNSGCMNADIGLKDSAIRDFSEAILLDPRLGEAYYNRALVFTSEGRIEEAIPDLSRAGELGIYQAYNLLKKIQKK